MMQLHTGTVKMVRPDSSPPVKVLIVEGHPAVRSALRQRLAATPQLDVVESVSDVAAALSWLETIGMSRSLHLEPDVIILGLQNGADSDLLDTLHEIRSLKNHPAAIIVLAPYADEVERVLLQTAGVKRYLLKHINSQQLIREIQKSAAESIGGTD